MNLRNSSIAVLFFIGVLIFFTYNMQHKDTYVPIFPTENLKIANWNLQVFGESKANDIQLMNSYIEKIKNYDIIFLQEIRDSSGIAHKSLCNSLINYNCAISSRAGTTSSKEQYLVIYKKDIVLEQFIDYNLLNYTNQFERPPIEVIFLINYTKYSNATRQETFNYNVSLWNIHIKPDDAERELNNLQNLIEYKPYTLILGDLNADCDYYDPKNNSLFKGWNWIIDDTQDTTVGSTNCAYDRIIMDNELFLRMNNKGIDTDITSEQSDHYLVWVSFNRDNSITLKK